MNLRVDHTAKQYWNVGLLFLCILIVNMLYTASVRADFNTIAGKSESNKLGQLLIKFTGADGKPDERELSVYYSDSNNNINDTVSVGRTGHPVSLVTGTYDIKILVHPTLWIRDVVIENGKTTDLDVGGYGRVLINGKHSNGNPLESDFYVYTDDDKKDLVVRGITNEVSEYILAGTYDVKVDTKFRIIKESITIVAGQDTILDLSQFGQLEVRGRNTLGAPLKTNRVFIYVRGERRFPSVHSLVNLPGELQPGIYDVRVEIGPDAWFEGVEIASGEERVIDLPELGRLMVQGKDSEGIPVNGYGYSVYEQENSDKEIAAGDVNVAKDLLPGEYDVRIDSDPEVWLRGIEIVAGSVKAIDIPPLPAKSEKSDELPGSAEQGRIQIVGKNALGDPLESYFAFYVYTPGDKEKSVAEESVSKPVDLPPGVYDIRVGLKPDVWFKSVEIAAGQSKQIELPLPGRLDVRGKNALGNSVNRDFYSTVYKSGDREKPLAYQYVNWHKDLPAGVYDILVNMNPSAWYEGVVITAGMSTVIELPVPGRLEIRGADVVGASLDAPFSVYTDGDREKVVADGVVNFPLGIQPGVYDIKIVLDKDEKWFNGIAIVSQQSKIIELSPPGRLWIYGKDEAGEPLSTSFTVYADGDKEIVVGRLNEKVDLPAGIYDVRIDLEPEAWYKGVTVVGGQIKKIDLSKPLEPVIPDETVTPEEKINAAGVGYAKLTAVPKDGADPYDTGVWWHVYPVGADGKPEEKYIDFNDSNPSNKFTLPPGRYLATLSVGEGSGRVEFDVKVGQTTEKVVVVGVGYAKLAAIPEEGASPYDTGVWWYVYPVGADGKPTEKYIESSSYNPSGIFTLPPGRYLATLSVGEGSGQVEFDVKVGETTEKVVVVGVGYAKLTAIPEEGAAPYDTGVWWYVYPVGADGKPTEKYIESSSYNPSGIFTLPPGRYLATLSVGEGSGQVEFDVKVAETIEKSVVIGVGFAKLTAIPEEGADPYDTASWYVYPVGTDGIPAEQHIGVSYYNPSDIFTLPPGRYQAVLTIGKGSAKTEFEVKVAETTEKSVVIGVGFAKLTAIPEEGADPYDTASWYVYPVGTDGIPAEQHIGVSYYNPSDIFTLPPGRYQAVLTIGKGSAKTEFEVKVAETTEKSVVIGVGFAKLTAIPEEGADPYDTASWYVYPVGTDGIPAEQHIGVSYYNPSDIFTLPPGRYQAVLTIGKGSAKTEFEVKVAETTEKSVVIGVGFAKLTAIPEEGADPYDTASWYVYPVGTDGIPAEQHIGVSYYNPSDIFTLPPGRYQAVLTIGKGSAKTEFEVKVAETTEKSVVVDTNSEEKE